ncbi:hypothetical protein D3C81_2276440 [compost metagenome]
MREQAGSLLHQQTAERALSGRPVKQQDAWLVIAGTQHLDVVEQAGIKVGQML